MELLLGRWIAEFNELAGMRKRDIEAVKTQISTQEDHARLAYGRETTIRPRQSIFLGSINPSGDGRYLRDATGNRRFWIVNVPRLIDFAGLAGARNQLWAEATHRYRTGTEKLFLEGEELTAAENMQRDRMEQHPWHDVLGEALEGKSGRVSSTDVYILLGFGDAKSLGQQQKNTVSVTMADLGWGRARVMRMPGSESRQYGFERLAPDHSAPWLVARLVAPGKYRLEVQP
jgi:predicted P-loop ATPase